MDATRWFCTRAFVLAILSARLDPAVAGDDADTRPFTIVMLPDTQYYSELYPEIYKAMTRWIVDNREAENIVGVVHVGDIVQNGRRGGSKPVEWKNADEAMSLLDGVVPWGIVAGNHDSDTPSFLKHFGPRRFEGKPWFLGSSPNRLSTAQIFSSGRHKVIALHLQINSPDTTLAWAEGVLDRHPGVPAIVSTHVYLTTPMAIPPAEFGREQFARYGPNSGEDIWNKFVRRRPEVFLVCCGHWPEEYTQFSRNDAGSTTIEMMCDYDGRPKRHRLGNGLMRLVTVKPADNQILMRTYSPPLDKWETDGDSQFVVELDLSKRSRPGPLPPTPAFPKPRSDLIPIIEYKFNETGLSCRSTGSVGQPIKMVTGSSPAEKDPHSVDGGGVSGKTGDRSLDLSRVDGMDRQASHRDGATLPIAPSPSLDELVTMTIQGWFRTVDGKRIASGASLVRYGTDAFGIRGEGDPKDGGFLAFAIGPGPEGVSRSQRAYDAVDEWVFFAVTYDGTMWVARVPNVFFYVGGLSDPVRRIAVARGSSLHPHTGSTSVGDKGLFIGDVGQGPFPFKGFLDNLRIFGSKTDTDRSGMLTLGELEILRVSDGGRLGY